MKIATIGVGYVGLVTSAVFADLGNDVISVNRDKQKCENLKKGIIPMYESDLADLVSRNVKLGRLKFTTDYAEAVPNADIIFIAVGTPSLADGSADLSQVKEAAATIAPLLENYTVVATKSTVPVGTNRIVGEILSAGKKSNATFDLASVPEFLREGSAVKDTMHPDRTVIGADAERSREMLIKLHKPLKAPFVLTTIESAEMLKYTANSFLAMKISFANAIAEICEKVGADVTDVMDGIGMDKRIGRAFLYPGPGYGGSCFPKDVKALIAIAKKAGIDFHLLHAVEDINAGQIDRILDKIKIMVGPLKGKTIAVLGLTFKANTDDVRASQPIEVIKRLLKLGASVRAYDPIAVPNAKKKMLASLDEKKFIYAENTVDALKDADVAVIITEWDEFVRLDFSQAEKVMRQRNVVDVRNLFDPEKVKAVGFRYVGMGR
ncbi:MAG: UDP-glucose/GDP-mannose dehydrogenase family protein [bacterium]|nr:UDP-glucose/GDP-mannose dehydrogenase family protein [bacterium]